MTQLPKALASVTVVMMPLSALAGTGLLADPSNTIILPGAGSGDQPAKVVSVGDGDTLTVSDGDRNTTIRVACIDAPEIKQAPYGARARVRLLQLAPVGSTVKIQAKDTDRYGRTVAEVFSGKTNVGLALVQEGHAVAYRQYLGGCNGNTYLNNEGQAQKRKLAFWSQPSPIMPWDFRRGGTATAQRPAQKPAQTLASNPSKDCDPAYPKVCIPPFGVVGDLNCGDVPFSQIVTLPADPHRFDGDKDGIGCE